MRTAAVVGTGLIGTSVGLALTARGVHVHLQDADTAAARIAEARGAGTTAPSSRPVDLAILAVPPAQVATVLQQQQRRLLAYSYTDVTSVKRGPEREVAGGSADSATFIGGHPMAGAERSGPWAACATLFEGRPWALTPLPRTTRETVNRALELVSLCGAVPILMESGVHDHAVAVVSHTPHLVAALMAAQLARISDDAARLAGQGVRDVTRIADGDPALWTQILQANAAAVADVLQDLGRDLEEAVEALRTLHEGADGERLAAAGRVTRLLAQGRQGRSRISGKHGSAPAVFTPVRVHVGDRPGELSQLLAEAAALDINVEDMSIEHAQQDSTGVVELAVAATAAPVLTRRLTEQGWDVQHVAVSGDVGEAIVRGTKPLAAARLG
ncbi:prephenate dehydrogenase [Streptomyces sp. NPDC058463]|uniref:prephenate dehydrogenase n=1 Tax=Streptomyces sp. NPDC058463 TaxID=3346510 RepID=UPI00364F327C